MLEDVDQFFDTLMAREQLIPTKTPSFRTEDAFQLAEKSDKDYSKEFLAARTAPTTEKKPHRESLFCHKSTDLIDRVRQKI